MKHDSGTGLYRLIRRYKSIPECIPITMELGKEVGISILGLQLVLGRSGRYWLPQCRYTQDFENIGIENIGI